MNFGKQELKAVQVFENGKLVPKKRAITLRMLLSHTGNVSHNPTHLPCPPFLQPLYHH